MIENGKIKEYQLTIAITDSNQFSTLKTNWEGHLQMVMTSRDF